MPEGWVKSWRKMLDNPFMQDVDAIGFFHILLHRAQRTRTEVWVAKIKRVIVLERGQVWLSVRGFKQNRMTERRVRTLISRFVEGRIFDTQTDTGITIITICNYDQYQLDGKLVTQQTAHHRHTTDTQSQERRESRESKEKHRERVANATAPNGASPPQPSQPTGQKTTHHPLPEPRNWTPKIWAELKARELLGDIDARYHRVLDEFREYEGGRGRLMKDWSFVFLGFVRKDAKWAADRADEQERFAQARARMALDNTGNDR